MFGKTFFLLCCVGVIFGMELENLKQDDVKIEADVKELRCDPGYGYCYAGFPVCIPTRWICDGFCDCGDCSDEPSICYAKGQLDEKYLTRMNRIKENPMTTAAKDSEAKFFWPYSSDPAAEEERVFAAPQYEYHGNFSAGEEGCIKDHNKINKKGIISLDDCKEACDDYSWCLSIEYNSNTKVCHLSEDTKNSAGSENWNSPCDDPHQDVMYYEWQQGHNLATEEPETEEAEREVAAAEVAAAEEPETEEAEREAAAAEEAKLVKKPKKY